MMHECLKGLSPSYLSDKFSTRAIVHDRQTRYRDSLNIPSCRINAGQRAFYYRGVKIWNNLSKGLKEIINTKVFKRRLINPLSPNSDQHQFSPNSIHRLSSATSMRINQMIIKRKISDLLSISPN